MASWILEYNLSMPKETMNSIFPWSSVITREHFKQHNNVFGRYNIIKSTGDF